MKQCVTTFVLKLVARTPSQRSSSASVASATPVSMARKNYFLNFQQKTKTTEKTNLKQWLCFLARHLKTARETCWAKLETTYKKLRKLVRNRKTCVEH